MGRVLGKVEAPQAAPRYFIHCSTTGLSMRPLFASASDAWAAYDSGRLRQLREAGPRQPVAAQVARLTLASSSALDGPADVMAEGVAVIADDWLLTPVDNSEDNCMLLNRAGQIHVAIEDNAGFGGTYHVPLCAPGSGFQPGDDAFPLQQALGRTLSWCPGCLKALCAPGRSAATVNTH